MKRIKQKVETKSPLKCSPLRVPGQSVQEEIDKLIDDQTMPSLMMAFFVVMLSVFNWLMWYKKTIPSPIIMTLLAVIFVAYAVWKIVRCRRKLKSLKLGRDGERAVGQYLDCLRDDGYVVYHDIVGDSFNVDHVLIGPGGIYTIETKTNSKPAKGEPKILYDGESLRVNGFKPERNPVTQAKAQAQWIHDFIKESTGRDQAVRPVVVYPGWFITGPKRPEVWVLNPKALPTYLSNEKQVLSKEDRQLFSFHLSRFIRSTTKIN